MWVTIDARDNDPAVLLSHVAAAFDRVEPLEPAVVAALQRHGETVWKKAVPRLAGALSASEDPLLVVLDGADLLRPKGGGEIITLLAENLPAGSTLVLSGRVAPRVPIARLRAEESCSR